jgi:iron complex outermembrane receptor protein
MAMAAPAFAQDGSPQSSEAESPNAEIIVTAQNRTQNVQDVPIAISVIGGETLKASGITDFSAIQRVAPVVNIVNDTTATRVTIRGIGSNASGEAQDQAVAVNIDGEYLNRPTVLNASLFDLDRVEVLRGPQGTLYGRNATGGAINFVTRKAGNDFGINGSLSYGNYDHVVAEGGIDVPLGDIGGIRASGFYSKRDGYFFHPNFNARTGDDDTKAGRISLRLEPAEGLKMNFAVERVAVDVAVPAQASINLNANGNGPVEGCLTAGWVEFAPLVPGSQCVPVATNFQPTINRSSYDAPRTGTGVNNTRSTAIRGTLQYDFGPATVTYNVGYRMTDRTSSVPLSPAFVFETFQDDVDTQSHELRLNGESDLLIWQLGGFYFKERQVIDRGLFNAGAPVAFLGANGGYQNYFRRPKVDAKSWAIFGQTDITLTDTLTAVVGARYTDDKRNAIFENLGTGFRNPTSALFNSGRTRITVPATAAQTQLLRSDADKLTWLAGLNFKPNDDTLVYAKVATGFKAGGFDSIGVFAPETNTAYEVGSKLNFGSNSQHTFNVSAFYNDYTDLQVSVLVDTTLGAQVFNAGKATIWGVEADAVFKLSDNDTFTASVNYLNSRFDRLLASVPVFCVNCGLGAVSDLDPSPTVLTQPNLAGNKPPLAPEWTIVVGYDKVIPLGDMGDLTASVMSTFKSSYFNDIFNFRDAQQRAFTNTDISLTYRPESRKWSLQAFARSLENARPIAFASFTVAGNDDLINYQFGAPRTYGVRLAFDF